MKKGAGLFITLILSIALPLSAQKGEPPVAFRFLSFTFSSMVMADTVLTWDAIHNHNCYEGNPFWVPIIDKPALVVPLDLAICAGVSIGARWLYGKNKALAWTFLLVANVIQGYYVLYQFGLRQDERWEE